MNEKERRLKIEFEVVTFGSTLQAQQTVRSIERELRTKGYDPRGLTFAELERSED